MLWIGWQLNPQELHWMADLMGDEPQWECSLMLARVKQPVAHQSSTGSSVAIFASQSKTYK
jgi:hypothetical protein